MKTLEQTFLLFIGGAAIITAAALLAVILFAFLTILPNLKLRR